MQLLYLNLAAAAVLLLYVLYRWYRDYEDNRRRLLRERIAYMLWVMTERV